MLIDYSYDIVSCNTTSMRKKLIIHFSVGQRNYWTQYTISHLKVYMICNAILYNLGKNAKYYIANKF